ncbi:DUF58 domain-containing protein [soil metagenome]
MLTRAGFGVVAASAVTLGAARLLAITELFVVGAVGMALVVAALVQVWRPRPRIIVERTLHPLRVHRGDRSRVELRIANRGRWSTPVLDLHDPVQGTSGARVSLGPLRAGAGQAASYRLATEERGLLRIGPLAAQLSDAFGLARRRFEVAPPATLTVLPTVYRLTALAGGGGLDDPLAGVSQPLLGSSGHEDFASLRSYVVGDDLRRVHWASSARAGDLLVRQDDPPWQGHVTVVLDGREDRIDPVRFEVAVSAAASVVQAVALKGDRVRLVMTGGTDTGLVDARGRLDTLLEHLALVQRHPGGRLPDIPVDGRSRTGALVVVSGDADRDDLGALGACRSRFASARLVVIDPSVVTGGARAPFPVATTAVVPVVVDADTSFPAAWAASVASAGRSGAR